MHLLIKKSTNEIKAVQGIAKCENTITTPFIGYDQNENINTGLYRLMSLKLIYEAEKTDAILNMSSGAPYFKALRGGRPCFEYHVVFDDHLPFYRRWLWDFLRFMSEYYIKPNMEKMKV